MQVVDQFHAALRKMLGPIIDDTMVQLAHGAANSYEEYHGYVGYIRAMNDVLRFCAEIEEERYGPRQGKEGS